MKIWPCNYARNVLRIVLAILCKIDAALLHFHYNQQFHAEILMCELP